ncbi:MAG: SRPBCC domain-containing protein [Phycisphaerales bacterium]|nr:SRPBCC domain-containing protein [Phycisphaerales bacterium]
MNTKEPYESSPGGYELVIKRVFDAPRELVFAAWTQPQHLRNWSAAPSWVTITEKHGEVRVGEMFNVTMRTPEGKDLHLQGKYLEVTAPVRLVFTHAWLNEAGEPKNHTLVTIELAEGGKKTELTLRQTGLPSAESRDGHNHGWNGALDNLEAYLASC